MNSVITKECVMCGNNYYINAKPRSSPRRGITVRPTHSHTCSHKCSMRYLDIKLAFNKKIVCLNSKIKTLERRLNKINGIQNKE